MQKYKRNIVKYNIIKQLGIGGDLILHVINSIAQFRRKNKVLPFKKLSNLKVVLKTVFSPIDN